MQLIGRQKLATCLVFFDVPAKGNWACSLFFTLVVLNSSHKS